MPKNPPKDYYASMTAPGTKKIAIVSKRLGTKERLVQVALCTNENIADKIVEALNHHQGDVEKMENVAQKISEQMREQLKAERAVSTALQMQITQLKNEKGRLEMERDCAMRELYAARAKAREAIELTPTPT